MHACVDVPVRVPAMWWCWAAAGCRRPRSPGAECCVPQSASLHPSGWGQMPLNLTVSVNYSITAPLNFTVTKMFSYYRLAQSSNWLVFHPAVDPSWSSVSAPNPSSCYTAPCGWHSPSPSDRADFSHWDREVFQSPESRWVECSGRKCRNYAFVGQHTSMACNISSFRCVCWH